MLPVEWFQSGRSNHDQPQPVKITMPMMTNSNGNAAPVRIQDQQQLGITGSWHGWYGFNKGCVNNDWLNIVRHLSIDHKAVGLQILIAVDLITSICSVSQRLAAFLSSGYPLGMVVAHAQSAQGGRQCNRIHTRPWLSTKFVVLDHQPMAHYGWLFMLFTHPWNVREI